MQKRERSPRENRPKGDFGGFLHGDLSPRQANIRQTVAENATHGMEYRVLSGGGAKGRHAKTRKSHHLAGFRVATFRVIAPVCRIFAWRGERSPRKNTTHGDFDGFSRGDLSPRQIKIRQTGGEKATHKKCRTFVCRGESSPCENAKKSPFGGFSCGAFSPFRPGNTIIRHGTNQPP